MRAFWFCSDKCRKTDEKNMSRMSKDISRTRESMKLTQGQLTSVQDTNKIVTGKFRRTQNQALIKEANLKVCSFFPDNTF